MTPITPTSLVDLHKIIFPQAQRMKTRYVRGWTLEQFLKENLVATMATLKARAPKRIRKKRAKAFLVQALREHRTRYLGELMTGEIRERWLRRVEVQDVPTPV